jgi:hypothetical protein
LSLQNHVLSPVPNPDYNIIVCVAKWRIRKASMNVKDIPWVNFFRKNVATVTR